MKRNRLLLTIPVILYLVAPFLSGMFGYSDPRGPKIYPADFHHFSNTVGRSLVGKRALIEPPAQRALFYGLSQEPLDVEAKRDEMRNYLRAQRTNTSQ